VATPKTARTLPPRRHRDARCDAGSAPRTAASDSPQPPPLALTATLAKLTIKLDRPQLTPEDIKKLEGAKAAAADGPVSDELDVVQRLEQKVDKIKECREKALAEKLDVVDRIKFVRACIQ
jgi:arylsulfatase